MLNQMENHSAKLNALIDGMADSLSRILNVRDGEVAPNERVIHTLEREKNYVPDRKRLDELELLKQDHELAIEAAELEEEIMQKAHDTYTNTELNVLLAQFVKRVPYLKRQNYMRVSGDGQQSCLIFYGGIAYRLQSVVQQHVQKWLERCDEVMTIHFEDRIETQKLNLLSSTHEDITYLIQGLSSAIAKRLTLCEMPNAAEDAAYELSTRILEARGQQEVSKSYMRATNTKSADLHAMRAILDLCVHGAESERARVILTSGLAHIERMHSSPPIELDGQNARAINIAFLHRVCQKDMDYCVKVRVLKYWIQQHGACASAAIQHAISKLEDWKPHEEPGFVPILGKGSKGDVQLPTPTFARPNRRWTLRRSDAYSQDRRSGLDFVGRRIVRLTSLVLELTAHGDFERGVVHPEIVGLVSAECMIHSIYCANLIDQKRKRESFGCKLLSASEHLSDPASDAYEETRKALCSLSYFSVAEIQTVFSPHSRILVEVQDQLYKKVKAGLIKGSANSPGIPELPKHYTRYAIDALGIMLPIIDASRKRHAVDPFSPSNCLADLMRTCVRVREWKPGNAPLRLTSSDLRAAHPGLAHCIKQFLKDKKFVRFYRPVLPDGRQFTNKVYEFDSLSMIKLLRL